MKTNQIHILYENADWLPPLIAALEAEEFEPRTVAVCEGIISDVPAPGIYLNRMSPSSHTRGNRHSVDLTREMLAWLEGHGARVVNGSRAFELEMSKLRQSMALEKYGILTPRTALAVGVDHLVELARTFDGPFITKHNRGGKGLGIVLFSSSEELCDHLKAGDFDFGPNGQVIIQQYIQAARPHITRVEIVGSKMILAMQSSTADGFELCPSDVCQINQAKQAQSSPDNCPIDGGAKFSSSPLSPDDPLVARYIAMCAGEGIELAGIEFVEDAQGRRYTYDINGTTNYNQTLGKEIGVDGMLELARYLRHVVVPQIG
ncbi:MAG: ATP-grasp domain-containing protein [Bradymonadaceae bacterium]